MSGLRLLPVVLALAACGNDIGFGVALSIGTDDTVSDTALTKVVTLVVTASGGEKGTYEVPVGHTFTRHEAFIYRPFTATRSLSLALTAIDADGAIIAAGATTPPALTLEAGKTTFAGVTLSAAMGDIDLGVVDQSGVDLVGRGATDGTTGPSDAGAAPEQPTNFQLITQSQSSMTMQWTPALPGSYAIAHYKIYRNGTAYDTTTNTSYVDTNAPSANTTDLDVPATIYSYWVSAIDTVGTESAIQKKMFAQIYSDGQSVWYNYAFFVTFDENDTTGMPPGGKQDVLVQSQGAHQYGGYGLASQPSASTVKHFEVGGFDHIQLMLRGAVANQDWTVLDGTSDQENNSYSFAADVSTYGALPAAKTWVTYSVPLKDLQLGVTKFMGSISGTTLTVSSIISGPDIWGGGVITGTGVSPRTVVTSQTGGDVGTYTVSVSQSVTNEPMTMQRTNISDFVIQDSTGALPVAWWVDHIMLTAN